MNNINAPVRVGVVFGPGNRIQPVWFDWRKKKHAIEQVTYRWHEREGDTVTLHFAVSDGADLFELVYNTGNQLWLLAALEVGNG